MNDKRMELLKEKYNNAPIPDELDYVVRKAIKKGRTQKTRWVAGVAVLVIAFVGGINVSSSMAGVLSDIPVIKNLVHVLTFREYKVDEGTYNANLEVPAINGLKDKNLEATLNQKYLEENKKLYDEFKEGTQDLKEQGGGHLGVDSGYVVKTDNDRLLAIGRYVVNTVGSSSTIFKYDTIDKKNEILITLPSLFIDDQYINVLSEEIKAQMRERMKEDTNKIYWVSSAEGGDNELPIESFDKISKDQSFYINSENKLVISFDKYEVAPGYMGVVEFILPTESIANLLVSNEYIK